MSINSKGLVQWTEPVPGTHTVEIRVSDDHGGQVVQSFTLIIQANNVPVISSEPASTGREGRALQYQLAASDPDGDSLTYNLASAPAGMTISASGLVEWPQPQPGGYAVTAEVSDGRGGTASQSFTLEIAANNPPVIDSQPATAGRDVLVYQYQVNASDPDNDVLLYSLSAGPTGLTINASGLVEWPSLQAGSHEVTVQADDNYGGGARQTYTLEIAANQSPSITSEAPTTGREGQPWEYTVLAEEPDGDPLHYSFLAAPAGLTIDETGLVAWPEPQPGTYAITIQVDDGYGAAVSQTFPWK